MATTPAARAVGVCAYSFPVSCGFLRRTSAVAPTLDAWGLVALAQRWQLGSVELPLHGMLPDTAPATLDAFAGALQRAKLDLVVDSGVVDVAELTALLPLAARAGARVVRATLSTILEGARGALPGGWDAYRDEMCARILALRPHLAEYGLTLALENHQDATSDDLVALCEAGGLHLGVTLDVANPLAVGEEPLRFARKVGPWIRNVHLKDYRIYPTAAGFRLVRCALGDGALPWLELLALLDEVAPHASRQIELAALYARHIRLLEDDWWQGYPLRDARELVSLLRLTTRHARPADEPWQTPWELGAPDEAVVGYEQMQFERSVRFLQGASQT